MSVSFRALILGAPGSGKGTIAGRIADRFGLYHLSSGDVLRTNIAKQTEVGQIAKDFIDQGRLVPDEVVNGLILTEVEKLKHQSWLLDGFPRTVAQAIELSKIAELALVINLNVPFDEIIRRVSQRWIHQGSGRIYNLEFNAPIVSGLDDVSGEPLKRRPDDEPETVKQRLILYSEITAPVIRYYEELGIIRDFFGRETNKIWPHVEITLRNAIGSSARTIA